ncbi:12300_t:CDS:1, partial [Funneliformis mosseae]
SSEQLSNYEFENDEIITNLEESKMLSQSQNDSLFHTSNKQKMSDKRIIQYLDAILKYNQVMVQKLSV